MRNGTSSAAKIQIVDLTLREGRQVPGQLFDCSVSQIIELLRLMICAGSRTIELTALGALPCFDIAPALIKEAKRLPGSVQVQLLLLFFNERGLGFAVGHEMPNLEGMFCSAVTANYRNKNYRQTDLPSIIGKLDPMLVGFNTHQLPFGRFIVSTAWGENGEEVSCDKLLEFLSPIMARAVEVGRPVQKIVLCDTVGNATPATVSEFVSVTKDRWPGSQVWAHLHPRNGAAVECVEAAFDAGVDGFEAAWCGVGGSPNATPPLSNLDIRTVLAVADRRGVEHGYDLGMVDELVTHLRGLIPTIQ